MKANLLGFISSLESNLKDIAATKQQHIMQRQQAIDENAGDATVTDYDNLIAEDDKHDALARTEFMANENFFKVGDMILLTTPDTEAIETQVIERELVQNGDTLDILYHFEGSEPLFQSDLDKENFESEKV